jgi:hypothetical protein
MDDDAQLLLPGFELLGPDVFEVESEHMSGRRSIETDSRLVPTARTIANFHAKIVTTPRCHWWTGAVSHPDGYGRICYRSGNVQRTLSTHRFALFIASGSLDAAMVAEHMCNETLCVRVHPEHVKPSTQRSNVNYAVAQGRHRGPHPGDIDPRGRYKRALAIRAALVDGYDPERLAAAMQTPPPPGLQPLFDLPDLLGA